MSLFNRERWGWLIPRAPECRMYRRSLLPMLVFMLMVVISVSLLDDLSSAWARSALVLSPLLPYLWIFRLYFDFLAECDELERKIELEAIAVAAMLVLFFLMGGLMLFASRTLPAGFGLGEALVTACLLLSIGYMAVRYFLLWRAWR